MSALRHACRSLLKSPMVTGAAVLSLALGIGVNAAIFSIFERLLLTPLPVERPEELVNLRAPGPKSGSQSSDISGSSDAVFSYPLFRDLQAARETREVFSGLAAHRTIAANLAFEGQTVSDQAALVSGSYFPVLGLQPALGRLLGPEDDRVGAPPAAVLSHGFWQTRLGARREVVGEPLVVNGRSLTIVGVAPRGFEGTSLGADPDVFVPLALAEDLMPTWDVFDNRLSHWAYLFARLAPDTSASRAQVIVTGPFRAVLQEVEAPLLTGMSDRTLERFVGREIVLDPGARGQSQVHKDASTPMLLLLCVTGVVWLIACANLANLLLVRATRRSGEIAVRMALGARRSQVVGQLLVESFVLAGVGSVLGLLVARITLGGFIAFLPSDTHLGLEASLGPVAWGFLLSLTAFTGLVGLFPALQTTRRDVSTTLQSHAGRGGASRRSQRARTTLVTVEIALAMALLVSAGLFTRSLVNVSRVELGIDLDRVATFGVSPGRSDYAPEASHALYSRLEQELAALPGVEGVAISSVPLLAGSNWSGNWTVEGFDAGPDTDTQASYGRVGPGYFRTLGIPLLAGRGIQPRDRQGAPKVAVVNEAFVRKFELGAEPLGTRIQFGAGGENDIEIVGLVENAKYSEVKDEIPPLVYLPYRQTEDPGSAYVYVRTAGDPSAVLPSLRRAVARLDPHLPVDDLRTLRAQREENVFLDRLLTTLSASFALLATLLAAIGLYGVVSYSVAQRTREIGLRMALGAGVGQIRRWMMSQVGWMVLVGGVVGLLAAAALGRLASSLLFGLAGHDPATWVAAAAVLSLIALAAGWGPAQRAARIDPMEALRDDA